MMCSDTPKIARAFANKVKAWLAKCSASVILSVVETLLHLSQKRSSCRALVIP